jgi:hypothetical protein
VQPGQGGLPPLPPPNPLNPNPSGR